MKFVPLGFTEEMYLDEILSKHPKGEEYGYLLKNQKEYPIFIDSVGNVLSMPPIINSNYTGRVDCNTKNVFIEVSGHKLNHISVALNIMVTALKERGGEIYSVDVKYGKENITTPNLSPKKAEVNIEKCRKILGIDITGEEMIKLLRQARFNAKNNGKVIKVEYMPYRNDIMDERDIIEEVAISFGYNDIEPEEPKIYTRGKELEIEHLSNKFREICIGLGLQEILTFTLTSKENILNKMRVSGNIVEIANPISSNWNVFRNSLIPGGLSFLSDNKHVEYPQKIFEIGDVLEIDERKETGYENISSILNSIMKNLGIKYSLEEENDKRFIDGRCSSIVVNNEKIGTMGEVHPEVLENFEIEKPVAGLEMNIEKLLP